MSDSEMNGYEIREHLKSAGLRQVDFVRLVAYFTGQSAANSNPSKALVSSWCAGRHAAPQTAYVVCRLFELLDDRQKNFIRSEIGAPAIGTPSHER